MNGKPPEKHIIKRSATKQPAQLSPNGKSGIVRRIAVFSKVSETLKNVRNK